MKQTKQALKAVAALKKIVEQLPNEKKMKIGKQYGEVCALLNAISCELHNTPGECCTFRIPDQFDLWMECYALECLFKN